MKEGVRRSRENQSWCIPDRERSQFVKACTTALMTDVRFVHKAKPMECVAGYDSTGEAVGVFTKIDSAASRPRMPHDAKRTTEVAYNRDERRFHSKEKPEKTISRADYLVLTADGKAIAGWKK